MGKENPALADISGGVEQGKEAATEHFMKKTKNCDVWDRLMGQRFHSESSNTRPVDIVIAEYCGDFQIFTSPELQPDTYTRSHRERYSPHLTHDRI
jgi:hypothetical protein